jgi:hypothetical protein
MNLVYYHVGSIETYVITIFWKAICIWFLGVGDKGYGAKTRVPGN